MTERNNKVIKAKGKDLMKAIKNIQDKRIRKYFSRCTKEKRINSEMVTKKIT